MKYYGFIPARQTPENLRKWIGSEWQKSAPPTEAAREVLKETDHETAIALLVALLESDNTYQGEVALLLGQIDPGNEIALDCLVDALQFAWLYPADFLDKDPTKRVTDYYDLVDPNQPFIDPELLRERADRLHQIDPNNETAISFLVELIQSDKTEGDVFQVAASSLAKFDSDNEIAIASLAEELQTTEDEYWRWLLATSLGKIDPGNETAIATLVQLIESTKKYCCSKEFFVYPGALDKTLGGSYDLDDFVFFKNRCILSARNLGEIDPGNKIAISALVQLLDPNQNKFILDDETRCYAAECLGKIDPGNEKAIAVLIELIQTEDWDILLEAITSLGEIGTGNEKAIAALVQLVQTDGDYRIAECLGKIDPGNEIAITTLVEWILNGGDEDETVANSLEPILQGNQFSKVVTALKHYMTEQVFKDNLFFYEACHDVLWRCAQNMSYPEFYRAWHGKPSSV